MSRFRACLSRLLVAYQSTSKAVSLPVVRTSVIDQAQRLRAFSSKSSPVELPDFTDTEKAYKYKSTRELRRAYWVFWLFKYDALVDRSLQLMKLCQRLLGQRLFTKLMRETIYGQFVAGEDAEEVCPTVACYRQQGIRAALAYQVEDDVHTHGMHGSLSDIERACDNNLRYTLMCINTAADTNECNDAFAAVKLTALVPTPLLMKMSQQLLTSQKIFSAMADKPNLLDGFVTVTTLHRGLNHLSKSVKESVSDRMFKELDVEKSGKVNWFQWLRPGTALQQYLCEQEVVDGLAPMTQYTESENQQIERMMKRLEKLGQCSRDRSVTLMVDAEQSYYQPAIRHITVDHLMPQFNTDRAVIYNTQQCYLKETYDSVRLDLAAAAHHNYHCGVKIVRGAYIALERALAKEQNCEDPVWPTKEGTDANYHRVLGLLLEKVKEKEASILVASHNETTVHYAIMRMAELGLSKEDGRVVFGQQLGMCDHISSSLASSGFKVYKYMPYGPVEEVLAYLSRRANENRGMLLGPVRERKLLSAELKRRSRL